MKDITTNEIAHLFVSSDTATLKVSELLALILEQTNMKIWELSEELLSMSTLYRIRQQSQLVSKSVVSKIVDYALSVGITKERMINGILKQNMVDTPENKELEKQCEKSKGIKNLFEDARKAIGCSKSELAAEFEIPLSEIDEAEKTGTGVCFSSIMKLIHGLPRFNYGVRSCVASSSYEVYKLENIQSLDTEEQHDENELILSYIYDVEVKDVQFIQDINQEVVTNFKRIVSNFSKASKMTQGEIARLLNISASSFSSILNGRMILRDGLIKETVNLIIRCGYTASKDHFVYPKGGLFQSSMYKDKLSSNKAVEPMYIPFEEEVNSAIETNREDVVTPTFTRGSINITFSEETLRKLNEGVTVSVTI